MRVASPVLSRVELGDALALRALELADGSPLGRFSYLQERQELWFEHTLLGDALDPVELELAVGHGRARRRRRGRRSRVGLRRSPLRGSQPGELTYASLAASSPAAESTALTIFW